MTTLCLADASAQLLAELYGDPRTSDADTPSHAAIARWREAAADLSRHAATEPTE